MSFLEVAGILRRRLGPLAARGPTQEAPEDDPPRPIIHNDRAREELGWRPRPAETTIVQSAESLRDLGLLGQKDDRYRHRTVVITGPARGLGRALTLEMAGRAEPGRPDLLLLGRPGETLTEVAVTARAAGATVHEIPCDLSRLADVRAAAATGRDLVDLAPAGTSPGVHAAGVAYARPSSRSCTTPTSSSGAPATGVAAARAQIAERQTKQPR